jgi:hypothetical protein
MYPLSVKHILECMEYNTMCRVIFILTEAVQQGDKAIMARLLNVLMSKVMEWF